MNTTKFTDSNNKYKHCPALMSDGRNFTDYRPISHINNLLIVNNNLKNNYTYREFLIQNAETIMKNNRTIAIENNTCDKCTGSYETTDSNTTCLTGTENKDLYAL